MSSTRSSKRAALRRDLELFEVWFKHTGMHNAGDELLINNSTRLYSIGQIQSAVGRHTLTHIFLSREMLPKIDELAPQLSHLRLFFFTSRQVSSPYFSRISRLKNLQVLHMSCNSLQHSGLPPDMFYTMKSLREIDVSACNLSTLPESLFHLESLVRLNASFNNFLMAELPDLFSSLVSLKELLLQNCSLKTLPPSAGKIPNLEMLILSENWLMTKQLLEVVCSISSLKKIILQNCRLKKLPVGIQFLDRLEYLDISLNSFVDFPPFICRIPNLKELNMSHCMFLKSLNSGIAGMSTLRTLRLAGNVALETPTVEICSRGLHAIKQFYQDLSEGVAKSFPFVTVAVLGSTMAGKTSLIRTLQNADRKRILTNRSPDAVTDETTKVFKMEKIEIGDTVLRLIDMGGQEVYHIAYQLTLRQNCIPVIVVNMQQYDKISREATGREAVRRLAFDYLSHLYLANPTLGAPKLVLTHKDQFKKVVFDTLKADFLQHALELCDDLVKEEKALGSHFCQIQHFNTTRGVFFVEDIYEVGTDDGYLVFDQIKTSLLESSQSFVKLLPQVWVEVNEKVASMPFAYNTVDEMLLAFQQQGLKLTQNQLRIILMYMNSCGKLLWYPDVESLQTFVFHKISEVTKLLLVLYNHESDAWNVESFVPYLDHRGMPVEKEEFEASMKRFKSTGLISESLLYWLIGKQTSFTRDSDVKVAVALLKSFRLLYGPLKQDSQEDAFIVPYFASNYFEAAITSEESLSLQVDLKFNGLSLPQYVFHQMSVGLLELFSDDVALPQVQQNGARVYCNDLDVKLIHNKVSRTASVSVTSSVEHIAAMWDMLISTTNNILKHLLKAWPVCRSVVLSYCAHCQLLGVAHPVKKVNPNWISLKGGLSKLNLHQELKMILCNEDRILSPFQYPCLPLSETDTHKFSDAVKQLRDCKRQSESLSAVSKSQSDGMADVLAANEDDLSDLSDEDDNLYPDEEFGEEMKLIRLNPTPTTNSRIRQLYSNTDKVFSMTRKRGRALIINNMNFDKRPDLCRQGSDVDVENMSAMLKVFKFDVVTHTDLKAEAMLLAVKEEVKCKEHEDLGCHVLVIMTHGGANNYIYGTDLKRVSLTDLYDLLTPLNFPGMAGKPKVVILEVCSGVRIDVGDRGIDPAPDIGQAQKEDTEIVSPQPAKVPGVVGSEAMNRLNYDDLLVVKASMESFISKIHPVYGSLMIRALVSSMYKHAGHHDLYTIFKQVQTKVRKLCVDRNLGSGQLVVAWDTLTHMRKLYLFPGFNGNKRENNS